MSGRSLAYPLRHASRKNHEAAVIEGPDEIAILDPPRHVSNAK